MQLLALFLQRAAAARARIRLIESGIPPDDIVTVDKRTEDFLIDDEQSDSHMSFWAHVKAMVESERAMTSIEGKLGRGACLLGVRAPEDRLSTVSALLKSTGARGQWKRSASASADREDRCSGWRPSARLR